MLGFPHIRRVAFPHYKIISYTCGESLLFVSYLIFSTWSTFVDLLEGDIMYDFLVFGGCFMKLGFPLAYRLTIVGFISK
jgi:hypothetical protein